MKNLIFALILFSGFASAQTNCPSSHHIFLLHGIGGGSGTFGSLMPMLTRKDPCYAVKTFVYNTGSFQTPYDFAKDFHKYVEGQGIRSQDKISLIMHSQGGVVGTLWLRELVARKSPFLPLLNSFITLSTPYWGTDIAYVGKTLFYTLPPGVKNPISPFGKNELNELSYGSGMVLDFARTQSDVHEAIPHLRSLAIAGMKSAYGPTLGEDDVVVPTHSMRSSIYYLKDVVNVFDRPGLLTEAKFRKTFDIPLRIVTADHIRLLGQGVADIPASCIQNVACGHPSVPLIIDHLAGKETQQKKPYALKRFRTTVYVSDFQKSELDPNEISIDVRPTDNTAGIRTIDRFNPFLGLGKLEKGLAFSFGGQVRQGQSAKLTVDLKYKNRIMKSFEVPVEAGMSSFLDLDLAVAPGI